MKQDIELEKIMKALANRRRLAAVRLIKRKKEMTVGAISDELRLSFKSTSKHLSLLVAADILEKEQRSIHMCFRLASDMPESARRIVALL
jgi:DNA-binding transcriptional ArsR family regulator